MRGRTTELRLSTSHKYGTPPMRGGAAAGTLWRKEVTWRSLRPRKDGLRSPPDGAGLEVVGLGKRYGDVVGAGRLQPDGAPGPRGRPAGPERRGQDDRRCAASSGSSRRTGARCAGTARRSTARPACASATCPRSAACIRTCGSARSSSTSRGCRGSIAAPPRPASTAGWPGSGSSERGEARLDALSHGNQQRVQLAAALVHDPVALVLDEPFAGLDPLGVEALSEVIGELARDGTAVLFSSHQLDLVEDVCQDVVVIDHGRVVHGGRARAPARRLQPALSRRRVPRQPTAGRRRSSTHACSTAEPGRTRLELTDGVDLEALVELARSAGDADALQPRAADAVGPLPRGGRAMTPDGDRSSSSRGARSPSARGAARS